MSATGEPIAFQRVTIVQSGYYRPGQIATDQNGWCEFGPVPSGEFTLECTDPRGRTSRARVTVPEVEGVAELTVQL